MTNSGGADGVSLQVVATNFGPPAKRRSHDCTVAVQADVAPLAVQAASVIDAAPFVVQSESAVSVAPVVVQTALPFCDDAESEYVGVSFSTVNPTVSPDLYQYEPWTVNFDPDDDESIEEFQSEHFEPEAAESFPSQVSQEFRSVFPTSREKGSPKNFYETFSAPVKPYIRRKKALDYYSRSDGSDINVGLTGLFLKARKDTGSGGVLR